MAIKPFKVIQAHRLWYQSEHVSGAWAERKTKRSGQKIGCSGAESGAGVAENDGAGAESGAGGLGAGNGLNRPLTVTARSNLTFYWLHSVYNSHSTVYRLLFQWMQFCYYLVTIGVNWLADVVSCD